MKRAKQRPYKMSALIIRKIKTHEKKIYLTFDDGPSDLTPKVLDLLNLYNAKATFFVVGKYVDKHPKIFQRILFEKHAAYSHSIDHSYLHYFSHDKKIKSWMLSSIKDLANKTGFISKIFRPPAGIITPPLKRAAKQEEIRLILWNTRFFDSVRKLSEAKVLSYLKKANPGDIILLHDLQNSKNEAHFLLALELLLSSLKQNDYIMESLQESDLT